MFSNPIGAVTAIGITATAIPIYLLCIAWKRKPKWIYSSNSKYILKIYVISKIKHFNLVYREIYDSVPKSLPSRTGSCQRKRILGNQASILFYCQISH